MLLWLHGFPQLLKQIELSTFFSRNYLLGLTMKKKKKNENEACKQNALKTPEI